MVLLGGGVTTVSTLSTSVAVAADVPLAFRTVIGCRSLPVSTNVSVVVLTVHMVVDQLNYDLRLTHADDSDAGTP